MHTSHNNTLIQYFNAGMDYDAYFSLITNLLAEGKTTGAAQYQTPEILAYAKLNVARMNRLHKTIVLNEALKEKLLSINQPQVWLVLTEGWCGDAAQILPVLHEMATVNSMVSLRLLLRDEHLPLMDAYLQNGKSRSIPKLIVVDKLSGKEIFNWGPRPAALQHIYNEMKVANATDEAVKTAIHTWYANDKTLLTQQELLNAFNGIASV